LFFGILKYREGEMGKALLKVFIFMIILVIGFMWVGYTITAMTGGERKAQGAVGVNPEGGEAIFWGKGRCSTCHSIGDKGSGVRCPNLGVSGDKFPLPIGLRAAERAKEREKQTGKPYTAVDYLLECIGNPSAYVVEGYKNEMPTVYAPPISLTLDEVKAVISYLQTQGGEANIEAINDPPGEGKNLLNRIAAAASAGGGDPTNGEKAFFDAGGAACGTCHTIKGNGKAVGPDLSAIGTKGVKQIQESIIDPSSAITQGFESYKVLTKDNNTIIGLKKGEDSSGVEILTAKGEVVKVEKANIAEMAQESKSLMPEEIREYITVKDYQDIVAYLLLQKG
jgi:putative heme-binding domain-containing protein